MRLRLPFSLRKSVLSCLVSMVALSLGSGSAWAVTESESQNLVFDGDALTWNTNTENKVFTNAAGESAPFAPGDNVTFASDASVSLGEDIFAGQINIASGADVVIELADNGLNFDTLSMLGGSLDAGDSLNIAAGETLAVGSNGSVLKSDLVLEKNASLSVDYAGTGSATSLNNSALSLLGGTRLQLSGCGNGDGKTYTLLTGVSELKDAKGNAISLNSTNNAIDKYFDTSQPGTGFWGNSTLRLTSEGSLQLVLHNGTINPASEFTERHPEGATYRYYSSVAFRGITYSPDDNSYTVYGGAVDGRSNSVELSYNGIVVFEGNEVNGTYAYGSAISGNYITLNNNGSVEFRGNTTSSTHGAYGGALYGDYISLNNNGSVKFSNNTVSGSSGFGGAIYGWNITLDNNGTVEFCDNGGAIYGRVMLSKNASVAFNRNTSSAIFGSATMINNGTITFQGNASGSGAATAVFSDGELRLQDNEVIIFEDNTARLGGAIMVYHYGGVKIENNGEVLFSKNSIISETSAYGSGGAIYVMYDSSLAIENNDAVVFEKNVEVCADSYRLRSVYVYSGFNEGSVVSFSAAENKKVEFRDSLYIGTNVELNFNADYTDAESKTQSQQGDIIFTGKYTESHLAEVKGIAGTAEEIHNSRTTEVNTMTNLYGGRLRVEDGAIYQGYGITAHEGSSATVRVKDATLSHSGYKLHFFEGTTLEALGESEIFGDVIVESTATAAFSALTRLEGSLTLVSGSKLLLDGEFTLNGTLTLGTGVALGGNVLELLNQLQCGQSLTLISGLNSLMLQSLNALSTTEHSALATNQELRAGDYFSNLNSNLVLKYNGEVGSLSVARVIPEPATTTLSLLALTALISRRRRK